MTDLRGLDAELHRPGHTFGKWLRCLRCGQDIAEKCRECRRLHDLRWHRAARAVLDAKGTEPR